MANELQTLVQHGFLDNKAEAVFHQMLPDFPAPAIEFVKRSVWIGPVKVPLDQIDTQHRATWTASQEPKKVQMHQQLIQAGLSKPIILAKFKDNPKYVILDAHHRFLAYEALKQPPEAFIGFIEPQDQEMALTAHSHQYGGGSKLQGPQEL